jgi:hypothetical protein
MAVTTLFTVVIPNELRGLSMTLVSATGAFFGMGAAPVAVSFLSSGSGGHAALGEALLATCAITSAVGAAALGFGARDFPR